MLIPRQVDMIMYLLNRNDWCSSEEISAVLRMAKNTIQPELRRIQEELRDGLVLESGNRGYRILELSGNAKAQVYDHLVSYGENKSIDIRPASILLYLLYLRQPITIRELSEVFYLSKSSIDLELKTVKGWLDQFEGLTLDISSNQGMRIQGSEKRKRVYCARIGSLKTVNSTPLGDELSAHYAHVLKTVNSILEQSLVAHGVMISGADFRRIVRFLASGVLRSKMGFRREREEVPGEIPAVVRDVSAKVSIELSCDPSEIEQWDLWEQIDQSTLLSDPPEHEEETLEHAMKDRLFEMDERAAELMALPADFRFSGRPYLLQYLEKIYRRYDNGDVQVNNLDSSIVREYPLEVHVASRMFPETFGGQATEETSAIALFLGANLRAYENRIDVLLVSNESRGVVYQILKVIRQFGYPAVRELEVVPEYAYRNDPGKYARFEIKLTTEPEIRLSEADFYYVPAILSQRQIYRLQDYFRTRSEARRTARIEETSRRIPLERVSVTEKVTDLGELVGIPEEAVQTSHWVRERVLFLCRMGRSQEPCLKVYELRSPTYYQRKKLSRLVYVACREMDPQLVDQFAYVSHILKSI